MYRGLALALALSLAGCGGSDYVGMSRQLGRSSESEDLQTPIVEHVRSYYHNDISRPRLDTMVLLLGNGSRIKHGRELEWFDTGQLRWEREFDHGEPSGLWRSWYPSGNPRSEATFGGSDELTPMLWWHEGGEISTEGMARNGAREGMWTSRYPDGTKKWEGLYRGNLREGMWTYWLPDGSLEERGLFRADERFGAWQRGERKPVDGDSEPAEANANSSGEPGSVEEPEDGPAAGTPPRLRPSQ